MRLLYFIDHPFSEGILLHSIIKKKRVHHHPQTIQPTQQKKNPQKDQKAQKRKKKIKKSYIFLLPSDPSDLLVPPFLSAFRVSRSLSRESSGGHGDS